MFGRLSLALIVTLALVLPQAASFDVLITNGRVFDGAGNPWIRADVGIRGDRVAAVGALAGAAATTTIDAAGRVVAPGFIDVHSHALDNITSRPATDTAAFGGSLREARALLAQGVTTVVGNPDGGGPLDLTQQAAQLGADGGIGVNAALLIGHATVRRAVIGAANRQPTRDELDKMRGLVRTAREAGAVGLSSGLFYTPGRFAKTEEVIALAREAGGVYTSHIRDEGSYDVGVVASVDEVIRIAEEAHVRGIVSHMKALGPDSWGKSAEMIAHIDAARGRGVDVFADQYPYDASSTSLAAAVMPGESSEGLKEAMANDAAKEKFLGLVRENIRRRGGPASIVMASGRGAAGLAGKSLEVIAKERSVSVEQAAADIVLAGGASIVSFNMSEADIEAIMRMPWTMGSSDGALSVPGPAMPHPRNNGSFARRIERYVLGRKTLTLVEAIRTMTSLPALVFGLTDRGMIRPGGFADIVIFDPAKVRERATYTSPHELSEGFEIVLVNGQIVRKEGVFTAVRTGVVLKR